MGSLFFPPSVCQSCSFTKAGMDGLDGAVRWRNVYFPAAFHSPAVHNLHIYHSTKCLECAAWIIYIGMQICGLVLHHTASPGRNHVIHSGANKYRAHFTPRFTPTLMVSEALSISAMHCVSRKKSAGGSSIYQLCVISERREGQEG